MILVLLAWTGTVPAVVDVPANPNYGPLVAGDGIACDGELTRSQDITVTPAERYDYDSDRISGHSIRRWRISDKTLVTSGAFGCGAAPKAEWLQII